MGDLKPDKVPVIFMIVFKSEMGLFEMTDEYSAYDEKEVIVQDGFQYLVTNKQLK